MVHFFGAQYNTIFSRYMWVQLDRKRNKALEKMQLPHSLENVPFVGWGHLLSKDMKKWCGVRYPAILISSVTEGWLQTVIQFFRGEIIRRYIPCTCVPQGPTGRHHRCSACALSSTRYKYVHVMYNAGYDF